MQAQERKRTFDTMLSACTLFISGIYLSNNRFAAFADLVSTRETGKSPPTALAQTEIHFFRIRSDGHRRTNDIESNLQIDKVKCRFLIPLFVLPFLSFHEQFAILPSSFHGINLPKRNL